MAKHSIPSPPAGRCSHLARGVSCVPQGIPQVLARPRGGVHNLHGKSRVSLSPRGVGVPVGLSDLLPHHNIEAAAGLVAKDEAGIVVVTVRVDIERAAEVDRPELVETWRPQGTSVVRNSLLGKSWRPRDPWTQVERALPFQPTGALSWAIRALRELNLPKVMRGLHRLR